MLFADPNPIQPADFERVREQFPALRDKAFLDAACVSLAPRAATEAIQKFLEMAWACPERSATLHHIAMDDMRAQARPQVARLIHAHEEEIALVESTTHGLNIATESIPLERGERVLVCELEFLEVAIPWCQKQKELGIEIDVVPHRNGKICVADIADRIGPRTRVLAISSVQWSNGFRCDLGALSALCRDRGVWLVVDAIQQLGAIPIDVEATPIDILTCGGHKWLNAPFGAGFLYIRRDALPRLRPTLGGYLSLETPAGGWGNYFQTPSITPVRDYRFVEEARRYEVGGTSNYPGAIGLAASLQLINELGPRRIAGRIYELTDYLIAGLDRLGVEVVTPREPEHRSGIVTFTLRSPQKNLALMEQLLERKVLVSVRYTSHVGGVRVSCHFFNSPAELDRLLSTVGRGMGRN
ncbi:MAG: aminotransferase class V-fold PLP-dependent enzyme [Acidobacteria bacterium]|nr:aminotransferase class V-fold PLP-dependent enzyme [Acidobacteriota bacterium]